MIAAARPGGAVRLGPPLPRSFFARPAEVVAPELLGRILVRTLPDGTRLAARIVEVEAYTPDDPASHSFRGPTARNRTMFGPPGHLYVYFTYGMHHCMNVVTGRRGEGAAVLLRAAEPLEGLAWMAERRGVADPRLLCSGPARLAQAFGVTREADGVDLVRGSALRLHAGDPVPPERIRVTTRIGINHGAERPWRFLVADDPFVSRPTGSRRS
jgi:DNA-3-methyladenine glycosylase